jgi:hypothetical protein
MVQLSESDLEELDQLWTELSRAVSCVGPPVSDDEMIQAEVDSLIAGVFSSAGRVSRQGLAAFDLAISGGARSSELQGILDRLAVLLGRQHES